MRGVGDVDRRRIGVIGISKGGMETYLAAAVDIRIAVAVPVIGVQSVGWAIANDAWRARIATFQGAVDRAAAKEGVGAVASSPASIRNSTRRQRCRSSHRAACS